MATGQANKRHDKRDKTRHGTTAQNKTLHNKKDKTKYTDGETIQAPPSMRTWAQTSLITLSFDATSQLRQPWKLAAPPLQTPCCSPSLSRYLSVCFSLTLLCLGFPPHQHGHSRPPHRKFVPGARLCFKRIRRRHRRAAKKCYSLSAVYGYGHGCRHRHRYSMGSLTCCTASARGISDTWLPPKDASCDADNNDSSRSA